MSIASPKVLRLFRQYADRPFVFVVPAGNHGDRLIRLGAEKLARLAGAHHTSVPYRQFDPAGLSRDAVVYVHGGGGLVPFWSQDVIRAFLRSVRQHPGVTVVGPQTAWTDERFLNDSLVRHLRALASERVVLFARDGVTFSALWEVLPDPVEIELDHDTALNVEPSDLSADGMVSAEYTLLALREDKEGTTIPDAEAAAARRSLRGAIVTDPVRSCGSFSEWVAVHARASGIVANRLHSAVLGAILGKPVVLMANSYHKNRSVWEHSLRDRGVAWANSLAEAVGVLAAHVESNGPH